ncbi:MAG: sigma-54-dependent Fis family transcriptional regulator [Deltaproteobacteria bacterium]|nr:sigma-54-dependent Fis family transcriptional regulator [Deltaproteobacteria bacterium]
MKKAGYNGTVLVVDDDENVRRLIHAILDNHDLKVITAENGEQALSQLRQGIPDIILLDIMMPGMNGIEVLKKIKEKSISSVVIMMTGYADIGIAVQAMKLGASEFLTKPFDNHKLISAIDDAMVKRFRLQEIEMMVDKGKSLCDLMGKGSEIQTIIQKINQVADTDFTVLIEGETGTGKELIANAIHKQSKRHDKRLVVVDCGAIPDNLIETELFGHEKGAFTGAHHRHEGYFFLANHGTLFLDEISNLSLSAQRKLLRILEERKIHPVGSEKSVDIDVRVIAASNLDLDKEAAGGRFRLDLYHRLKEFCISLPPLRERRDDILFITQRFIKETGAELKKDAPKLSDEAAECILSYEWPGNVRELRNTVRRATLMAGAIITLEHLDVKSVCCRVKKHDIGADLAFKDASHKAAADTEKRMIQEALKASDGNKSKAARFLNIDYKTLLNKIKSYGIHSITMV